MQNLKEISTIIENFYHNISNENYKEAIDLYYKYLDRPLYCSGENKKIIELLSVFLGEKKNVLKPIIQSQQERIFHSLASIHKVVGEPKRAIDLYEILLGFYKNRSDYRRCGIVLRNLSRIRMSLGKLSNAEKCLNDAIELFKKINENGLEAGAHRQLGILLTYEGKYKEAENELAYLPKTFGKHTHSDFAVYTDMCLNALLDKRKLSKVLYYAKEMEKLSQKYPYKNDIVVSEWLLGLSYLHTGDIRRAEIHIDNAIVICREINCVEIEADILLAKACLYSANKNIHMAMSTAKEALSIATKCEYKLKQADIHNFLGNLELYSGDYKIVEKHARDAHTLAMCDGRPHYYKVAVIEAERILKELQIKPPIEFYSCFISYSHEDKIFAHRLHEALKIRDIECWLDEHKILPGDYFLSNIDEGIKKYDKFLLICSKKSLTSFWVDTEIDKALQKEKQLWKEQKKRILVMIPLDIDGYLHKEWQDPKASILYTRLSADFTDWEYDDEKFLKQFEKLMIALRVDTSA